MRVQKKLGESERQVGWEQILLLFASMTRSQLCLQQRILNNIKCKHVLQDHYSRPQDAETGAL